MHHKSVLHRFVLHNDDIREAADRVLSPGQAGLLAGWGVFTTMMVADGVPFAFERHWARLARDAAIMHVPMPDDPAALLRRLGELIEANHAQHSTLRLAILRNSGGMWASAGHSRASDVIALTADTKQWQDGVRLIYAAHARHGADRFAGTKILSWAPNLVRLEEAQAQGFDEVILLNERGEVAECTSANIFIAVGGRVWTPPLSSGCLAGVTRELLLNEVRVPEFPVEEKTLVPADLEGADDVFITSTTRGLLGVAVIGKHQVGTQTRARAALQTALSAYVQEYVALRRDMGQAQKSGSK